MKLAKRTIEHLALPPAEAEAILDGFAKKKGSFEPSSTEQMTLTMDQFYLVSGWQHFALLALIQTGEFEGQGSEEWIAKRLGLKISEVKSVIERLVRLGLLKVVPGDKEGDKEESGKIVPTGAPLEFSEEFAETALQWAHLEALELARSSLERDAIGERDFFSATMPIDKQKIGVAKTMIREFQKKLEEVLGATEKNEVYKLCIQLFHYRNQFSSQMPL
jgi:uncharacterized protein (TIGR02147 family)